MAFTKTNLSSLLISVFQFEWHSFLTVVTQTAILTMSRASHVCFWLLQIMKRRLAVTSIRRQDERHMWNADYETAESSKRRSVRSVCACGDVITKGIVITELSFQLQVHTYYIHQRYAWNSSRQRTWLQANTVRRKVTFHACLFFTFKHTCYHIYLSKHATFSAVSECTCSVPFSKQRAIINLLFLLVKKLCVCCEAGNKLLIILKLITAINVCFMDGV